MPNNRRPRARKREGSQHAGEILETALKLRGELLKSLGETETIPEYDELIRLLHELKELEEKARNNLKTNLRNNK